MTPEGTSTTIRLMDKPTAFLAACAKAGVEPLRIDHLAMLAGAMLTGTIADAQCLH